MSTPQRIVLKTLQLLKEGLDPISRDILRVAQEGKQMTLMPGNVAGLSGRSTKLHVPAAGRAPRPKVSRTIPSEQSLEEQVTHYTTAMFPEVEKRVRNALIKGGASPDVAPTLRALEGAVKAAKRHIIRDVGPESRARLVHRGTPIYHVTTQFKKLRETGYISSGQEGLAARQRPSTGLGGGSGSTSFTPNPHIAMNIARSLSRAGQVGRGEAGIPTFRQWARQDERLGGLPKGVMDTLVNDLETRYGSRIRTQLNRLAVREMEEVRELRAAYKEQGRVGVEEAEKETRKRFKELRNSTRRFETWMAYKEYLRTRGHYAPVGMTQKDLSKPRYMEVPPALRDPVLINSWEEYAKIPKQNIGIVRVDPMDIPPEAQVHYGRHDLQNEEITVMGDVPLHNSHIYKSSLPAGALITGVGGERVLDEKGKKRDTNRDKYMPIAMQMGRERGLPLGLLEMALEQESGWNPNAKSPTGVVGIAQITDAAAREVGLTAEYFRTHPVEAIRYKADRLANSMKKYDGDPVAALLEYNAGPRVADYYHQNGALPPPISSYYGRNVDPYRKREEAANHVSSILGKIQTDDPLSRAVLAGGPVSTEVDPISAAVLGQDQRPTIWDYARVAGQLTAVGMKAGSKRLAQGGITNEVLRNPVALTRQVAANIRATPGGMEALDEFFSGPTAGDITDVVLNWLHPGLMKRFTKAAKRLGTGEPDPGMEFWPNRTLGLLGTAFLEDLWMPSEGEKQAVAQMLDRVQFPVGTRESQQETFEMLINPSNIALIPGGRLGFKALRAGLRTLGWTKNPNAVRSATQTINHAGEAVREGATSPLDLGPTKLVHKIVDNSEAGIGTVTLPPGISHEDVLRSILRGSLREKLQGFQIRTLEDGSKEVLVYKRGVAPTHEAKRFWQKTGYFVGQVVNHNGTPMTVDKIDIANKTVELAGKATRARVKLNDLGKPLDVSIESIDPKLEQKVIETFVGPKQPKLGKKRAKKVEVAPPVEIAAERAGVPADVVKGVRRAAGGPPGALQDYLQAATGEPIKIYEPSGGMVPGVTSPPLDVGRQGAPQMTGLQATAEGVTATAPVKFRHAVEKLITPLPKELGGARPHYGPYPLRFDRDVDRALFIVAQKTPSRRDAEYMAWLKTVFHDLSETQIRELGGLVRSHIGRHVKRQSPGSLVRIPVFPIP